MATLQWKRYCHECIWARDLCNASVPCSTNDSLAVCTRFPPTAMHDTDGRFVARYPPLPCCVCGEFRNSQ